MELSLIASPCIVILAQKQLYYMEEFPFTGHTTAEITEGLHHLPVLLPAAVKRPKTRQYYSVKWGKPSSKIRYIRIFSSIYSLNTQYGVIYVCDVLECMVISPTYCHYCPKTS